MRIDFARHDGQWSGEMVPGAGDYQRWDVNQSKLVSGDLGGTYSPTKSIVIGGAGISSSALVASGGVTTATGGRVVVAASADDFPQFATPRTRTIMVPIEGCFGAGDFGTPATFQFARDDTYGWGVKATGAGTGLVLSVPGRCLHIGSTLLSASLTYIVTVKPTAAPSAPMYLLFFGLSSTNAQTFANPSLFTTVPSFTTGNILQWNSGAAVSVGEYFIPFTLPVGAAYYYTVSNAGSGTIGSTEPTWPVTVGATTTPDSNGVVWTCTGQLGASLSHGETANAYYANGAVQTMTAQYDGAGSGGYSNVISAGLRYAVVIQELDPTVLITGLELTFGEITSLAFP